MNTRTESKYLWEKSTVAARVTEARSFPSVGRFAIEQFTPGLHVLDAGCGPGAITTGIAERVSPGRVIGIDADADALTKARELAQKKKIENLEFQEADLERSPLPFPDDTFDAVWMHAVLYHLTNRNACLKEIWRVLKPGGFVALRDSYYLGNVVYPPNKLVLRAFDLTQELLRSRGADPNLGPRHREMLLATGFGNVVAAASYENFSKSEGDLGEYVRNQHLPFLREGRIREEILQQGHTTEAELAAIETALMEWGASPSGVFLTCRCEAMGDKVGRH